ncbi:MAG: DUF3106 domain-containing protein [Rubrivivax sp.]|nr:DUF3106 domain-containing protein [Rubrivivax sp.]
MLRWAQGLVAVPLALAAALVLAQTPPAATPARSVPAAAEARPTWSSLTPAQQLQLGPLKSEWSGIDAARKQKWLDLAARMPTMPAAERERIQQRMTEWVRLSPAERGQARLQFQETRQVPATMRQEQWEAYQALPADKRQALAAKASQPPPKARTSAGTAVAGAATPAPASKDRAAAADAAPREAKRNIVAAGPSGATRQPIAPTVVQARPGATTSLVTTDPSPPAHHQPGLPKVNAGAGFVDPATLLPKRGPQGAAAAQPSPAASGAAESQ